MIEPFSTYFTIMKMSKYVMREIIIQRLIKSRERILAGGYYGNKRKLSTD